MRITDLINSVSAISAPALARQVRLGAIELAGQTDNRGPRSRAQAVAAALAARQAQDISARQPDTVELSGLTPAQGPDSQPPEDGQLGPGLVEKLVRQRAIFTFRSPPLVGGGSFDLTLDVEVAYRTLRQIGPGSNLDTTG